jgi:hypothetical protein
MEETYTPQVSSLQPIDEIAIPGESNIDEWNAERIAKDSGTAAAAAAKRTIAATSEELKKTPKGTGNGPEEAAEALARAHEASQANQFAEGVYEGTGVPAVINFDLKKTARNWDVTGGDALEALVKQTVARLSGDAKAHGRDIGGGLTILVTHGVATEGAALGRAGAAAVTERAAVAFDVSAGLDEALTQGARDVMGNGPLPGSPPVPVYAEGSFSIVDWTGYPAGGPKPTGPFRLLEGAEQESARKAADAANKGLHKTDPGKYGGKQIHEVHPVKFGGDPVGEANKIGLTPKEHAKFTTFWNRLMRDLKK